MSAVSRSMVDKAGWGVAAVDSTFLVIADLADCSTQYSLHNAGLYNCICDHIRLGDGRVSGKVNGGHVKHSYI